MKASNFQRVLCGLVLLALLLSTSGCSLQAELMALALEFWPEYLAYKAKGTSGIPEVDAMLEAKSQLDEIDQADKLAAEGRKEGDIDKIRDAMAMRPGDWRYRYQAGAVALEQGDLDRAEQYFSSAESRDQKPVHIDNPAISGEDWVNPRQQYAIEVLEESRQKMQDRGWKSRAQCEYTYDQLIANYHLVRSPSYTWSSKEEAIIAQLNDEKARLCPK